MTVGAAHRPYGGIQVMSPASLVASRTRPAPGGPFPAGPFPAGPFPAGPFPAGPLPAGLRLPSEP
jgi:hypothetical protein